MKVMRIVLICYAVLALLFAIVMVRLIYEVPREPITQQLLDGVREVGKAWRGGK